MDSYKMIVMLALNIGLAYSAWTALDVIKASLGSRRALITTIVWVICFILLIFVPKAQASDAVEYQHYRHTDFYVGFANTETTVAEASWQALNVIDTMQSIQGAKNPTCYRELGPLRIVSEHPSVRDTYIAMSVFGIAHYLGAKGLDHLVVEYPDYMVLQRIYQYVGLGLKGFTVAHNASIGLGFDHSRNCGL